MAETTVFISNSLFHIAKIFELMKQPNGTTVKELCKELNINKRSIFRLLKIIEQKLCIPFTMNRSTFGGTASYHLSPAFVEKLSGINLPELRLTFNQSLFIYLVLKDIPISKNILISGEIDQLQKFLETLYNL